VAILAEAAAGAAARRRATPAANQSRYLMRAVAGVAVVGVGILLWRQTDHRLPGEAPVMEVASVQEDAALPAAPGETALTPQAPPASAARRAADAGATADSAALVADQSREQRLEQAPAPVQPPAMEAESVAQKSTVPPVTGQSANAGAAAPVAELDAQAQAAREQAAAPAPAAELVEAPVTATVTAPFVALGAAEADALLRRHFPAQYQSDTAHRLWLVRNAAGEVLQSDELMPGQSLADVAPQIQGWRTTSVPNTNGQPIELNIVDIP
jgi:hypothetical protein